MSQGKLRELPHSLTLPELLGSAGNWIPPGINHKLKGVRLGQWSKRQTGPYQPLWSL